MQKSGFTLLELSIVMIIIGLIIGGITVGADMIRAAELNSVVTDVNKYKTAINTFKLKYNALPGDMDNAHDYWDDGADGVCGTAAQCNGDNNGEIGNVGSESDRSWQHMSLAGVIAGSYDGNYPAGAATLGVSIPASSVEGAGFMLWSPTAGLYVENAGNYLSLGVWEEDNQFSWLGSFLTPADASTIDTKMDDGLPRAGKVNAYHGTEDTTGCFSGADYVLSTTTLECKMYFRVN